MARILEEETKEVLHKVERRSWRIQVFCDIKLAGNYVAEFLREKATYVDGVLVGEPEKTGTVSRTISQFHSKQVKLANGMILTGAQVAEAVAAFGDTLEEEDETGVYPTPTPDPEE